jgi:hypothetical protein
MGASSCQCVLVDSVASTPASAIDTPLDFLEASEGLPWLAMPQAPFRARQSRLHRCPHGIVEMCESNEELVQSLEPHGEMEPVQQMLGTWAEMPLQ